MVVTAETKLGKSNRSTTKLSEKTRRGLNIDGIHQNASKVLLLLTNSMNRKVARSSFIRTSLIFIIFFLSFDEWTLSKNVKTLGTLTGALTLCSTFSTSLIVKTSLTLRLLRRKLVS